MSRRQRGAVRAHLPAGAAGGGGPPRGAAGGGGPPRGAARPLLRPAAHLPAGHHGQRARPHQPLKSRKLCRIGLCCLSIYLVVDIFIMRIMFISVSDLIIYSLCLFCWT